MYWDTRDEVADAIMDFREVFGLTAEEVTEWDTYRETVTLRGTIEFLEVMKNLDGLTFGPDEEAVAFTAMDHYMAHSLNSAGIDQKLGRNWRSWEPDFDFDLTGAQQAFVERMSQLLDWVLNRFVFECWSASSDFEYRVVSNGADVELSVPDALIPHLRGVEVGIEATALEADSNGGYSLDEDYSEYPYEFSKEAIGKSVFAGNIQVEVDTESDYGCWDSEGGVVFESKNWPALLGRILREHFDLDIPVGYENTQKEIDHEGTAKAA